METISLCGYYCISCGYVIVLWIMDIILFQAERLQKCFFVNERLKEMLEENCEEHSTPDSTEGQYQWKTKEHS